ncbi:right-handed parallel beta-helix repeat-containing protein [Pigmentiphaga sp. YJ18]|uniref:right-handed parallel beta-helix repeat-containing protein n=1 Tax=Pigmentiphaga sp. YJ18 TaxID=3134907 RepID=UPI003116573B
MQRRTLVKAAAILPGLLLPRIGYPQTKSSTQRKITDYGAKGDGISDDSFAFSAASQDVSKGQLTQLIIPPGKYRLNHPILYPGGPQAFSFKAEQPGTVVIVLDDQLTYSRPIIFRNFRQGLEILGINFQDEHLYKKTGKISNLVDIQNSQKIRVENCSFTGASFYGLGVYENTEKGAKPLPCDDLVVRNNAFSRIGVIGLEIFPKITSRNCEVSGNIFKECGGNWEEIKSRGKIIAPSSTCAMKPGQCYINATVHSNNIESCPGGGIYLGNIESLDCYSNHLVNVGLGQRGSQASAIALTIAAHSLGYRGKFEKTIIRDNKIEWTSSLASRHAAILLNGSGIESAKNVLFSGNQIIGRTVAFDIYLKSSPQSAIEFIKNIVDVNITSSPIIIRSSKNRTGLNLAVKENIVINNSLKSPPFINLNTNDGAIDGVLLDKNTFLGLSSKLIDAVGAISQIRVSNNLLVADSNTSSSLDIVTTKDPKVQIASENNEAYGSREVRWIPGSSTSDSTAGNRILSIDSKTQNLQSQTGALRTKPTVIRETATAPQTNLKCEFGDVVARRESRGIRGGWVCIGTTNDARWLPYGPQ